MSVLKSWSELQKMHEACRIVVDTLETLAQAVAHVAAVTRGRELGHPQRAVLVLETRFWPEDVFELSEGLVMGVRVGPHEKSRAKYFINHQGEIKDILRFLIQCIDRTPESSAGGESDMIGAETRADDP